MRQSGRGSRRQRHLDHEDEELDRDGGHRSPPRDTSDEDLAGDEDTGLKLDFTGGQWIRDKTNPFQAFVESIVFGTAATIGSVDYFANKGGWPLKQAIPDNFFSVLALLYGVSEMAEGLAIYRGSENPDMRNGRSYAFPNLKDIPQTSINNNGFPFGYSEREQTLKGVLQMLTAFFITEGAVEGFIANSGGSPVGLSALGFNLPARLCAHFVGKCLADFYDFYKLSQETNMFPAQQRTANQTILFNLFTNALAATAFGLLAHGDPLGFVFLAGFALARSWQNKHRPGLFKSWFPPIDEHGKKQQLTSTRQLR